MSSIIFVGSPEKYEKSRSSKDKIKKLFLVSPYSLLWRILTSLVPPFGKTFRRVHVDFLGPTLGFVILASVLNYGYAWKPIKIWIGPTEFLFLYALVMPLICYILVKLGQSEVYLIELISLLGYALYGKIFTLTLSYICFEETNNAFFFLCLIIFGGLSTFRLILILLTTIPYPGPRLIICSFVAITQVLTLFFLHFGYMHRTFIYGQKS